MSENRQKIYCYMLVYLQVKFCTWDGSKLNCALFQTRFQISHTFIVPSYEALMILLSANCSIH